MQRDGSEPPVPSRPSTDLSTDTADRLDELADTAELMGDDDGAHQWRERAAAVRLAAMQRLDG